MMLVLYEFLCQVSSVFCFGFCQVSSMWGFVGGGGGGGVVFFVSSTSSFHPKEPGCHT